VPSVKRSVRFSAAAFVLALVAVCGGAWAGLVAVPRVGTFLGMLGGGFLLGAASGSRPVAEGALAGTVAALSVLGAAGIPGTGPVGAVTALGAVEPTRLSLTVALGAFSGGLGAHLGDDVRDGLTEPVDGDARGSGGRREDTGGHENPGTVTASVGSPATSEPTATLSDDERPTDNRGEPERDSGTDADRDRELLRESADE